jgi:archaeosine synthase
MLTNERGLISLTLEGAKILAEENAYCVEIEDFVPKGDVFAVGVINATPEIRIGDDVAVVCKNELRAVGVAGMSAEEIVESDRGVAVKIRARIGK